MKTIGIIGGGITGLCCAYYLQREGFHITVIDQGDLSDGSSYGNAGMIVPSHVIPLAAPGIMNKGLKWMVNSKSPFYIHPAFRKELLRWGWLFYKSSTAKNVVRAIPALRDISRLSRELYIDLVQETGIPGFSQRGLFMLYQTAAAEKEEIEAAGMAGKAGVEAHVVSTAEVERMEPEVKMKVRGGVYYPGDAHLTPPLLMEGLKAYLKNKGVRFLTETKVINFYIEKDEIKQVITDQKDIVFDEVIVAGGSWSPFLLQKLKVQLPLQAGKGYSFGIKKPVQKINIPSLLIEGKVAVTPMSGFLRLSGTMEITGINQVVNMKRVEGIIRTVNDFYPDMKVKLPPKKEVWSGLRPCSPDGLPFLGRLKGINNAIIATGHGMMGVSLGPATGRLVSEIITGEQTDIGLDVFAPERFDS